MPSVTLAGVAKTYPNGAVGLRPTDLHLDAGDRLALLGPSGSGKTTLLRLIAGLETPDAGEVRIGGRPVNGVPPHRRGVALLAQRPALYPHLTVRENLEVPLRLARGKCSPLAEAADLLRLGPLLDRRPHQLSGGERQRVALGKLLARGAGVWLLDEPFAALDPVFRAEFRDDLHLLLAARSATMVLVTHDPIDALALGRRVGVLGSGSVQQVGPADVLRDRPGSRFVAFCLGRYNLIDGRAGGGDPSGTSFVSEDGSVVVPLPGYVARHAAARPAPDLTLGIRPDDVLTGPAGPPELGAVFRGWPVVSAEPDGSGWRLTLARRRCRVRAGWRSGPPPPVGDPVDWSLPADRCVWFDGPTGRRIAPG